MKITKGLKNWFFAHFVIDMLFAVALIFFPGLIVGLFGFPVENLVFVRLVGAALIGIGMAPLFTKKKEAFEIMLTLKIFWSVSAIIVLIWGLVVSGNNWLWLFICVFVVFSFTWFYYKFKPVKAEI